MTNTTLPMIRRNLPPMPIYYGNAPMSYLALTLFPDDLILARRYVARWLVDRGALQDALDQGVQIDNKYMAAILDDCRGPEPTLKLIDKRRYWSSACGQIVKVLFALVNSNDPRVREAASFKEAIQQAERMIGRSERERKAYTSFHPQLRRFRRSLHMAAALELIREDPLQPARSPEGWMLNAMYIHRRLYAWHMQRQFSGSRAGYLDGEVFWAWPGMDWTPEHGVPDIGLGYEHLTPRGGLGGRPPKIIPET